MKKLLTATLTAILLFTAVMPQAFAQGAPSQKEEVVYGILGSDGSVSDIYVVNIFDGGGIVDFGDYNEVRNLTTSDRIEQDGDYITINTTAEKLYYQGTLSSKELPWNFSVRYFLDGNEISPVTLAGKSGTLEIAIAVTQNPNINDTFFNNFTLQIAVVLDTKLCADINADNATVAEAGSNKQLTYTVMPGQTAEISVTADVHDFEMEPITINGIRMSFNFDIDLGEFSDQIAQLIDAIGQLDGGAEDLLDGAAQLADGMTKYVDGVKAFKDGMSELSGGINKLDAGAAALNDGLAGLSKQNDNLVNGALAIQQSAFDAVNSQLTGSGLPVLTPENYRAILEGNPQLAPALAQLDGAVQFTEGLKSYTDGVSQLGTGASQLANGLSELKTSAAKLPASANELYNASAELNAAIKTLRDGIAEYKGGTKELKNETSDFDSEIGKMADEILSSISGNGDEPMSFVSDKNTNVTAVQFVLKTSSVKQAEADIPVSEKPAELNFWQKLLKLFGLYK